MAELQRAETSVGPVAIDGRTITFVARTRAIRFGHGDRAGAVHVRARPTHVEVLNQDGRHEVVRIHDVERAVMTAIAVGGLTCALAVRALRKGGAHDR